MTRYRDLTYTVPPGHSSPLGEVAFAKTPDEVVRRTRLGDGSPPEYCVADLSSMSGEFESQNRAPSVPRDAWTPVSGEDETPC